MNQDKSYTVFFLRNIFALLLLFAISPVVSGGSLLNERTYKRLAQIHKLIEKNDYSEALSHLDKLMEQTGNRNYDKAVIQQTYGFVYEAMNRQNMAITSFNNSLSYEALPIAAAQGVRINLASLYFAIGKTKESLEYFEKWIGIENKPAAGVLVFGGSLYAENGDYDKAVLYINRAINISKEPKESWYQRIAAIYIKMEDYTKAAKILSILIEKYPTKALYWKQLSACYYYSGDEKKSVSVLVLANQKKLLQSEKEQIDLAKLLASQNTPFQASKIFVEGLQNGVINKNAKNMELLAQIYMQAQERDRAIQAFLDAASISENPEIYMKVASLYSDSHQWDKVLAILDKHLPAASKLKASGLILKGIALYETGKIEASRKVFQQVSSQQENAKLAASWLEYLRLVPTP